MGKLEWIAAGLLLQLVAVSANRAGAQPVIDGTADAAYGPALSVQDTRTQFGDNSSADLIATATGGSEIDQVFATVANDGTQDRLYVTVTGNLETNFNKLEVFIDSLAGVGQNEINGSTVPSMVDGFCCATGNIPNDNDGALQRQDFLKFDVGFAADYYLTFSNGSENIGGDNFWAVSAHFADLNNGTDGRNVAAGIQLAPQGLPNVLRAPNAADFNENFNTYGEDFLTWQRGQGVGTTKAEGDADLNGAVNDVDLGIWMEQYGTDRTLANDFFVPFDGGPSTADLILQPSLPGLGQGELIDQIYALGADGGCTAAKDDGGAGCAFPELEFVLPVDSNDADNVLNHRNFNNEIDLQLGFDNSNIAGVLGGDGTEVEIGDPENVLTGLEFSIPLAELGLAATGFVGDIKFTAFINGGGHDFIANQFSGDGVNGGNFGTGTPDLSTQADGDQFVTVVVGTGGLSAVPEPGSALLLVAGVVPFLTRRQG